MLPSIIPFMTCCRINASYPGEPSSAALEEWQRMRPIFAAVREDSTAELPQFESTRTLTALAKTSKVAPGFAIRAPAEQLIRLDAPTSGKRRRAERLVDRDI